MRSLFKSELRVIRNILSKHVGREVPQPLNLVSEYYVPPRGVATARRFNLDFVLEFVDRTSMTQNHVSFAASILPNTIGVDVFVTFDKESYAPLVMELMGGEGLPPGYFRKYIDRIDEYCNGYRTTLEPTRTLPFTIPDAHYARVLVVNNDICFLVFPDSNVPIQFGSEKCLKADAEGELYCYHQDERLICIDGWISSCTPRTARQLIVEYRT
jgi:hypothetical protein